MKDDDDDDDDDDTAIEFPLGGSSPYTNNK